MTDQVFACLFFLKARRHAISVMSDDGDPERLVIVLSGPDYRSMRACAELLLTDARDTQIGRSEVLLGSFGCTQPTAIHVLPCSFTTPKGAHMVILQRAGKEIQPQGCEPYPKGLPLIYTTTSFADSQHIATLIHGCADQIFPCTVVKPVKKSLQ